MLNRIYQTRRAWWGGVWLMLAVLVTAEEPKNTGNNPAKKSDAGSFIRVRRDAKKNPIAMETSIVRYASVEKGGKAATVDLVSAFHIGEKKYYDDLNKAFEDYDVVLYELVAPLGTRVPKGGGNKDSMLSKVQKFMKDTLALEFQLDQIDYTKANFVHADMSAADIAKSMSDKGESWMTIITRMMSYSMAQQAKNGGDDGSAELLAAIFSKNRPLALKRAIANQMDINDTLSALEGADGSTLISGRNAVALGILKKQIAEGKRKIAIFYGGGHMPDFDKRLRADFKLTPGEPRWLTAWDLHDKAAEKKEAEKSK